MLMSGLRKAALATMIMWPAVVFADLGDPMKIDIPFCLSYEVQSTTYKNERGEVDSVWADLYLSEYRYADNRLKDLWLQTERGDAWPELSPHQAWAFAKDIGVIQFFVDLHTDKEIYAERLSSCQPIIWGAMNRITGYGSSSR